MSRTLTPAALAASLASVKNIAILMTASFDSGNINLFTGYGQIVVNSITYQGTGQLVNFQPAAESADLQANSATFQLSGVQTADIALSLTENYQGRPCDMKLAFFDASGNLIADPVAIFGGRMDVMTLTDDPANPIMTLTAENEFIRLSNTRFRTRTHADQQIDYPGDMGLSFVASLQNKVIYW